MRKWPPILLMGALNGVIFSGLFVASWAAYFCGDGERVAFCTAAEVFAGPLLVGSVRAFRRPPASMRLLRLGALLFVAFPPLFRSMWHLRTDESYIAYMSDG